MRYWRTLFLLVVALLVCNTAEAQLFKKWKKKKVKTEVAMEQSQVVNTDTLQLPMADISTCRDNRLNRMAFLDIPLGISAKGFHERLTMQGFSEPTDQQGHYYLYQGRALGETVRVILMQSDSTHTVYAVDLEESAIRQSESEVRRRFQEVKQELTKVYGKGYVCNNGEQYVINTQLGTVTLHYERTTGGGGFVVGYAIEDAKADAQAFAEAEWQAAEEQPRRITERGLAEMLLHSDMAGIAQLVMQAGTPQKARAALAVYDYTVGRETAAVLPAEFLMGDYKAKVSIGKKARAITSVTVTANDTPELVKADLLRMGYTEKEGSYTNGVLNAKLQTAADNTLTLTMSRPGTAKSAKPVRRGRRR